MSTKPIIQGTFKEELKNRFLCLVKVDGVDTLCYIPSSCRLSNFVDLKEKTVLLTPIKSTKSRTHYSVYAVLLHGRYVLLNMSTSNQVVEQFICSRRFAFLGKRKSVCKEHIIEGYKSDLYIEDTRTIVEIKSILSFERTAHFPSVYSQRAIEQLKKLSILLDKGYNVCYIFMSMNSRVKSLMINSDIPEFCELINECVRKGMILKGFSLALNVEGKVSIHSKIVIEEKGGNDGR